MSGDWGYSDLMIDSMLRVVLQSRSNKLLSKTIEQQERKEALSEIANLLIRFFLLLVANQLNPIALFFGNGNLSDL